MGISSIFRAGGSSFFSGGASDSSGADFSKSSNSANDQRDVISFATGERNSQFRYGSNSVANDAPKANEREKVGAGGTPEWLKRLLAMMGISSGEDSGPGPGPGPSPSPSPGPRPGPGPNPGIDGKKSNGPNSKSENLKDYDPDKAKGVVAKSDEQITSGFVQGQEGNCATVSGIKAAMMKFGADPKDIYKSVEKTDDGYKVIQEDGKRVDLSDAELDQAKQAANFNGDDKELIKNATFMFAVSAKRAQMEGNDGATTFAGGLNSLNNGDYSEAGLKRLGLGEFIRPTNAAELAAGEIGTIDRDGHAVAVMDGKEELWGREGGAPITGNATKLTTVRQ